MIKLYDVIDTRSGEYYSIAVVKEKNARYFIPAESDDDDNAE